MEGYFRVGVQWLLPSPSVWGGREVHPGKEVILSGTSEFHTENLSHTPWGHLQPLKASFRRGGGCGGPRKSLIAIVLGSLTGSPGKLFWGLRNGRGTKVPHRGTRSRELPTSPIDSEDAERDPRACPATRWPRPPACPSTLGSPKLPQASRGRTEIGDICLCPLGSGRRPPASRIFPQEPPNPRRRSKQMASLKESCSPASPKPSLQRRY